MRPGNWLSLRDVGELDEVKNLREAEETHVVFSRHGRIDTLKGAEGAVERKRSGLGRSSRGEGASPTAVRGSLGEGKVRRASAL